jgi:hypothetical protein
MDTLVVPLLHRREARHVADEVMRAHIIIPRELVASVDRLVGKRARSRFVAEAVSEKLARERRAKVLTEAAGALAEDAIPEWGDSTAWVRRSRDRDAARLERLWKEPG